MWSETEIDNPEKVELITLAIVCKIRMYNSLTTLAIVYEISKILVYDKSVNKCVHMSMFSRPSILLFFFTSN